MPPETETQPAAETEVQPEDAGNPGGETTPPEKPETTSAAETSADVLARKTAEEIVKNMAARPQGAPPTQEEVLERLQEASGMDAKQLAYMQNFVNEAIAPYRERDTVRDVEERIPDAKNFRAEIAAELARHPAQQKADPKVLADLTERYYYMLKGKSVASGAVQRPAASPQRSGGRTVETKIHQPFNGGARSLESGSGAPAAKLTEEQKTTAARMGISEEDYLRSSKTDSVSTIAEEMGRKPFMKR